MKHTLPSSQRQLKRTGALWVLGALIATSVGAPQVALAGSWNPTLLVNTESFSTVEDGDGTTDIQVRFGTSGKEIEWDITNLRFNFDDDVHTTGNITGSGTVTADGEVKTKDNLTINSDSGAADAVVTFGSDGTDETLQFLNDEDRFEFSDDVSVTGSLTASGKIILEEGQEISLNGVSYLFPYSDGSASGKVLKTDSSGNLSWSDDNGDTVSAGQGITVNNSVISLTATHSGTVIEATQLLSGASVHAQDDLTSSGSLTVEGTMSGAALYGAGLYDCDGANDKIIWDASTGKFACGTDVDNNTNQLTTFTLDGDDADTETIAHNDTLLIQGAAGGSIETDVESTDTLNIDVSDDSIDGTELADAFTVDADTTFTFGSNDFIFDLTSTGDFEIQDGGQPLFFADGENGRIGIGTITAETELEVIGTISGSQVHAQDTLTSSGDLVVEGTVSGALLRGFGLADCDGAGNTLQWDVTTGTFSCTSVTGETSEAGQGLTLNGSVLSLSATHSGTNILALDRLTASGVVVQHSATDTTTAFQIFDADGGNPVVNVDTTNERLGIGTNSPTDTLDVDGTANISGNVTLGSTLTFGGVEYTAPTSDGSASGKVLTTDGAGQLSWSDGGGGTGSGGVMYLQAEYPHAVYFSSGSSFIGQLTASGGVAADNQNSYVWTSSKGTLQDYWVSARVRVPDNFSQWDDNEPIEFTYRTGNASAAVNHVTLRLLDTAGSEVSLTGASGLANTSYTTATITGPEGSGTYTPGEYITLLVKTATTSSGRAQAGAINLNWETTAP